MGVVSFTPRSLYPRWKSPRYPLDKRLSKFLNCSFQNLRRFIFAQVAYMMYPQIQRQRETRCAMSVHIAKGCGKIIQFPTALHNLARCEMDVGASDSRLNDVHHLITSTYNSTMLAKLISRDASRACICHLRGNLAHFIFHGSFQITVWNTQP
jgi:hypothetical protein